MPRRELIKPRVCSLDLCGRSGYPGVVDSVEDQLREVPLTQPRGLSWSASVDLLSLLKSGDVQQDVEVGQQALHDTAHAVLAH